MASTIVKPKALVIFYNNNHKEVALYQKEKEEFGNFRPLTLNEYNGLVQESEKRRFAFLSDRIIYFLSEKRFAFKVRSQIKTFHFENNEYKVKIPKCIMYYNNGSLSIFTYNKLFDRIYTLPFANVNEINVCMGNVKKDKINKIFDMDKKCSHIENLFFGSTFTDHFYSEQKKNSFSNLMNTGKYPLNNKNYYGTFKKLFSN